MQTLSQAPKFVSLTTTLSTNLNRDLKKLHPAPTEAKSLQVWPQKALCTPGRSWSLYFPSHFKLCLHEASIHTGWGL